jgi:hypothetical protein
MPINKAARFLRRVLFTVLAIAAAGGILIAIQLLFNPFASQVAQIESWLRQGDSLAKRQLMQGLSFGMIALALIVGFIPLFMKGVSKKQYIVATQRSVIASVILFATQALYAWAEKLGDLYLIMIMAGVTLLAFILIETLSLLMGEDKEVAFRTDLLACTSASLIAGIIFKLISLLVSRI